VTDTDTDPAATPLAIACALSPGEYAERLREFRRLFAAALRDVRREPTRLHLTLEAAPGREAQVQDLLRRKQECCPFFEFAVEARADAVVVRATVPDGDDECLDDLERHAGRALGGRRA